MRSRGFTLVEAMVALMILSLISGAVILMTLQVVFVTTSSKARNQAVSYATELLEQVRDYQLTSGWTKLSEKGLLNNSPATKCYSSLWTEITSLAQCPTDFSCSGTDTGAQISGTNFYRFVLVRTETSSPPFVNAKSVVSWKDKGQCRQAEVDTGFYNY